MPSLAIENRLSDLFQAWAGKRPELLLPLAPSGSDRIYYRLQYRDRSAIGTYNPNEQENRAFIGFSRHFRGLQLPVPEIYAEDLEHGIYLQEDLGSTTLYSYLLQREEFFPDYLLQIYKRVVEQLARLQIIGGKELDYGLCYPKERFDRQSILWDFNAFKYYFLRPSGVQYNEVALDAEANQLADFLLEGETDYFLFRDFQTRNIMLVNGQPYFIDYQGGRRGALQYDLASLLYQAKANLPEDIRQELVDHYLDAVGQLIEIDRAAFQSYYYGYVLVRCIQVLGTYGYRGLFERKEHFLQSIPFALRNVKWLFDNQKIDLELPELGAGFSQIIDSKQYEPFDKIKAGSSLLLVRINSFSYKHGLPPDPSGNGGGFIFDCRFIHNPGRYETYKKMTGRDEPVINFLKHHSSMEAFLEDVYRIVDTAVEDYIERSFTSLQVNFGCTGGQHRSVYAADALARHLTQKYGLKLEVYHREQERKGWEN